MILIQRLIPESERLIEMGLRIGLAVVVGFLAERVLFLLVGRAEQWIRRAGRGQDHSRQRADTVGGILRSLITTAVGGVVVVYALGVLGWDVRPLLGGAAVLGVALGFGAQTLVRDVIAGVFILAEDQYGVGDLIEVSGKAATVEALTVRSTTLRDFNGFLHYVPNGEMRIVVNRSRGWNRLAVDVPVASDSDADRGLATCRRIAEALSAEPEWRTRLLDPVQVWGIEQFSAAELQIRMVIRSEAGPDAGEVARELRRRVHGALAAAGIRLSAQREIAIVPVEATEAQPPTTPRAS